MGGLVAEPSEEESLLAIPMEIFMISFDDVPHLTMLLKYQVVDDQPQASIGSIDILDPRLPTRITRPAPAKSLAANSAAILANRKKRPIQSEENEWGGMKFHCTLTKISTMTAAQMRLHIAGALYQKMAASTPTWDTCQDKKDLFEILGEAEQLEQYQKRARTAMNATNAAVAAGMKGKGKGKR